MAKEIMLVKSGDGFLYGSTGYDQEVIASIGVGKAIKVQAKAVNHPRSVQHHRLFFGGLMTLLLDYWEPDGGLVSPAEEGTLRRFASWLDKKGKNSGAIRAVGEEFINELKSSRASKVQVPEKTMVGLLTWLKLQVGHYSLESVPGGVIKIPKSISFESMDQDEFNEFYKACFNVAWNYILYRVFDSADEAQEAIDKLLEMG